MSAATQSQPPQESNNQAPPSFKTLSRLSQIPLVQTVHKTLEQNYLTQTPYAISVSLTAKAYDLSTPIQTRLAPVLLRADDYANMGLDAVQSRYPYPFEKSGEDMYKDLKSVPDHAVKTASDLAAELDGRLTPLVNRYESVVSRFASSTPTSPNGEPSTSEMKLTAHSQVDRAYKLTLSLRNSLYDLSTEQLRQLQNPTAIVQRITESVYDLNTTLVAHARVTSEHTVANVKSVSQSIVEQLQKIQQTTASLPSHLHSTIKPLSDRITSSISSISGILTSSDIPIGEKAKKIREEVTKEVQPLVDSTLDSLHVYVEEARKYMLKGEEKGEEKVAQMNGNGKAH